MGGSKEKRKRLRLPKAVLQLLGQDAGEKEMSAWAKPAAGAREAHRYPRAGQHRPEGGGAEESDFRIWNQTTNK